MLDLLKVSITGDPSSGKTEACRVFRRLGAYVVNADRVSHRFLVPHTYVGRRVIDLLGPEIIVQNTLDRSVIAQKVFHHPVLLRELEAILHPEVCRAIEEQYCQAVQEGGFSLFIAEVPLLYEIHYDNWFDKVLLIVANEELRKERFVRKMGSDVSFYQRCERFLDLQEKITRADAVIVNNGTREELHHKVEEYFYALKGAL